MKTAMQELIEWTNQYEGKMISADQVVLKAYKLLEKEKEQIIDAANSAYEDKTTWGERYYIGKYKLKIKEGVIKAF